MGQRRGKYQSSPEGGSPRGQLPHTAPSIHGANANSHWADRASREENTEGSEGTWREAQRALAIAQPLKRASRRQTAPEL
jgi:hypothetical protein